MAKKYEVIITPSAQKDLTEIKSYLTNVLKTSSNSIFEKILEQVKILKVHPFSPELREARLQKASLLADPGLLRENAVQILEVQVVHWTLVNSHWSAVIRKAD